MRRRRLLALVAGGMGFVAGCPSQSDSNPESSPTPVTTASTNTPTPARTQTSTPAETPTETATATPRENPDTIFVSPDGSDANPGSRANPIRLIQEGFNRAQPGQTIHALPGRYHERVETVRPGTPEQPIVLTGPPEAVFVGGNETPLPEPLKIFHSHIHVLGLTFDGLQNPDKPDVVSKTAPGGSSYAQSNIQVNPFSSGSEDAFPGYIRDVTVKPHGVGNVLGAMINTFFAHDVEIGEFRVIGPGGLKHLKGNREGHNGEVVYVGTPADKFGGYGTDISGATIDESSGYHIHHIVNDEGYPHAELVDIKAGCEDVTIEYCTDRGGAARYVLPDSEPTSETAFHLGGNDTTLRWCIVENSHGQAVEVGSWDATHPEDFEEYKGFPLPEGFRDTGQDNAVYRNRFVGNAGLAIQYPVVYPDDGEAYIPDGYGPDAQQAVCGNDIDGETHGQPAKPCPGSLPTAEPIGHRGGDSPYA